MPATTDVAADATITVHVPAELMPLFQRDARDALATYADNLRDLLDCDRKREQRAREAGAELPPLDEYADTRARIRQADALFTRALEWANAAPQFEVTAGYRVLREVTANVATALAEEAAAAAARMDPTELRAALRDLEPAIALREEVEGAAPGAQRGDSPGASLMSALPSHERRALHDVAFAAAYEYQSSSTGALDATKDMDASATAAHERMTGELHAELEATIERVAARWSGDPGEAVAA
jgi:hypothetical protein